MRALVFISLVLFLTDLAITQEYKSYNTFNKDVELQKFVERGGKVEEVSLDVYKLTYRTGESRTFYFKSKEDVFENNEPVDTTIINIWEIDTTKFSGMFTFWQQVQVANLNLEPIPVKDLNNNGQFEIYGFSNALSNNRVGPVKIYEQNINGSFEEIFEYDTSTIYVKAIGDINGDENSEIVLCSTDDGGALVFFYPIYKTDSQNSLPTKFDFNYYIDTLQINNMLFGDWDKNGFTDCIVATSDIWDTTMCAIATYKDSINKFEEVFQLSSIFESVFSGFAINDFDQNGKTELVASSGPGNIFVIENMNENEYSVVNQFPFPTPNTYMQTATNDIDENGKPEFWIGGQDFEEGITVFQCYEADGDNSYKQIARIELRYLASFYNYYIQAVDIDDDAKEELIISIGNVILILKFVGSPGNHQYKLWYAKLGEGTQPDAQFNPVAIADLNGDGKKDLLIPMERYTPSINYAFSYILRQDGTTGVGSINGDNFYYQNFIKSYPVPFNSTSSVRFSIAKGSYAKIKVYNSLGKEIKTLLEEQLSPGEYNIQWDARDKYGSPLPSGIYFISLQTDNVFKTTKTIFLK